MDYVDNSIDPKLAAEGQKAAVCRLQDLLHSRNADKSLNISKTKGISKGQQLLEEMQGLGVRPKVVKQDISGDPLHLDASGHVDPDDHHLLYSDGNESPMDHEDVEKEQH